MTSLAQHHSFLDANKRTAVGGALAFLSFNGFVVTENREEELADLVLAYLNKTASKDDLIRYFQDHSIAKED